MVSCNRIIHDKRRFFIYNFIRHNSTKTKSYVDVNFSLKYDCKRVEHGKYANWEKCGDFLPKEEALRWKDPFVMLLPPPNITGTLHLGHALTVTIQDVLCRWKRMQGIPVLWIPGTDHAGIATQVVVEKHLLKERGISRHELGREKFVHEINRWKESKENKIVEQIKQLGASLDWSRYLFTMDENNSDAVKEAVIRLFDDGLLYRDNSFINWCCDLRSTISDIEVDILHISGPTELNIPGYKDPVHFGYLYEFAYKVCDSDEEILVSTTRLETIYGDVAVAVHPDDSRYSHLRGSYVWNPFRQCKMPIIFDDFVDMSFGTGAVKITPAHSKVDIGVSKRHNLPVIQLISDSGLMSENCGELKDVPRFTAKEIMAKKLTDMGLLKNVKPHSVDLPICSRTGDVIEYMLKPQWFLKCSDMSRQVLNILKNEEVSIRPSWAKKLLLTWLEKDQDWCLSRQLYWGHQLPIYKTEHGYIAANSKEEARLKAEAKYSSCSYVEQETDVVDTWFSSSLLPFTALGWPKTTGSDYETYYPLSLMETGRDIACFWVLRMMMLGVHFTGTIPFKKVLLHGMLCDAEGRKMSKTLGNVVELDHVVNGITLKELNESVRSLYQSGVLSKKQFQKAISNQKNLFPNGIPACGADALRLTMIMHDVTKVNFQFSVNYCNQHTAFSNKMWQALRFSVYWLNTYKVSTDNGSLAKPIFEWHFWILDSLARLVEVVNQSLEDMHFHLASNALRDFFVEDLCDIYLELAKTVFKSGTEEEAVATCSILLYCLEVYLRLMAPVMPFVTEELYAFLPGNEGKLVRYAAFPVASEYEKWKNNLSEEVALVKNVLNTIRSLKSDLRNFEKNANVVIVSERKAPIEKFVLIIETIGKCVVEFREAPPSDDLYVANYFENHTTTYLKFKAEQDISTYEKRMKNKLWKLEKELKFRQYSLLGEKGDRKSEEERIQISNVIKELESEIKKILSVQRYMEEVSSKLSKN